MDRVRPVQTDGPGFIQDLCHEHAIPYAYEQSFDEALIADLIEDVAGDSPKAMEIRRLRLEARLLRVEYAMDRRRTRLLQEESRLREIADRLELEILEEASL
jgi:hypothetical protein